MKKIAMLSVISVLLMSCAKTNEEAERGNSHGNPGACDTVNMKYAANIQPIISANCYSCHGNGAAESGVSLDSYDKLKLHANSGNLMGVITHAAGYPPMPQSRPKLSDCDIYKIKAWIERGSLNN